SAPAARAAGWDGLAAGAVGPAAARLADLRPGVAVAPAAQPDPDAAELAALVQELFVLRPRARADRRSAWLAERATAFPHWAAAAHVVRRTDTPLARLEPRLFHWLAAGAPPTRVEPRTGEAARAEPRKRKKKRGRKRVSRVGTIVLGVLLPPLLVLLAAQFLRVGHRPPPPPAVGPYSAPVKAPFTAAEVWAFTEYERVGRVGPPPYRWQDWVRAGKPRAGGAP
ncbi:MAG TPA: hypothetical protein VH092_08320, partial [Urbifossiella sp.]|nr:hypothetical protein [Urbifossiella sp.]